MTNHKILLVDDDRDVVLLDRSANEFRREPVHRHGLAAQIPDIDIGQMLCWNPQRLINVFKTVQAAGPIQLQIDV